MNLPEFTKSLYRHKHSDSVIKNSIRVMNKVSDEFTDEEIAAKTVDEIFDRCVERELCKDTKTTRDGYVNAINNYKRYLGEIE